MQLRCIICDDTALFSVCQIGGASAAILTTRVGLHTSGKPAPWGQGGEYSEAVHLRPCSLSQHHRQGQAVARRLPRVRPHAGERTASLSFARLRAKPDGSGMRFLISAANRAQAHCIHRGLRCATPLPPSKRHLWVITAIRFLTRIDDYGIIQSCAATALHNMVH